MHYSSLALLSLSAAVAEAAALDARTATPAICSTLASCYSRFGQATTAAAYCSSYLLAPTKSVTITTTLTASTSIVTKIVTVKGSTTVPQTSTLEGAASYVTSYQPCTTGLLSATSASSSTTTIARVAARQVGGVPGCLQYMVAPGAPATTSACKCIASAATPTASFTKTVTPKVFTYTWTGTVNLKTTIRPVQVVTVTPTYTVTMDPLPCVLSVSTPTSPSTPMSTSTSTSTPLTTTTPTTFSTTSPTTTPPPSTSAPSRTFPTLGCSAGTAYTAGTNVFNYCTSLYAYGYNIVGASNPYPTNPADCVARCTDTCVAANWAGPNNCQLGFTNVWKASVFSTWNPVWTAYVLSTTIGGSTPTSTSTPSPTVTPAPSTPTSTSSPVPTTTAIVNPASCGNQGLEFEIFQDIGGWGHSPPYSSFGNYIAGIPYNAPDFTGIINTLGGGVWLLSSDYTTSVSGTPSFYGEHWAMNMQGYMYAPQTGMYSFVLAQPDDYIAVWVGANAQAGSYSQANANSVNYYSMGTTTSFTYNMTAGQYVPFRAIFANDWGQGHYQLNVTMPDGTAFNGLNENKYLVQYSCDAQGNGGGQAPEWPSWPTQTSTSYYPSSSGYDYYDYY